MPTRNQLHQIKGVITQQKKLDGYSYSSHSQKLKQRFPFEQRPVTDPYKTGGKIMGWIEKVDTI